MKHLIACLVCGATLVGCAQQSATDVALAEVQAVAFRSAEPPSITVFTMINNRTGRGGHSALMVNASQRVIFDPAGSFRNEQMVERGDVIYGITPGWLQAYKSAHARQTHHVVSQKVVLSPEQAEKALRLVQSNGAVAGAFCAQATTAILQQIQGFEGIDRTFFPENLMGQMAARPDVVTSRLYEDDAGRPIDAARAAELAQES
ncbi:MAG: hypothetical protein AAF943_04850 [Pseudomonadota bacterium]